MLQDGAIEVLAGYLLPEDGTTSKPAALLEPFVAAVLPVLENTRILSIISDLQRNLDPLDIEGLSALWASSRPKGLKVGEGETDPVLEDYEAFVQQHPDPSARDPTRPQTSELQHYITAYLLSASFKDCSVILRFPAGGEPTITAIDLDPKSVARLHKWEKLDREIVDTFSKRDDLERTRKCVDAHAAK